ncbi:hypothetical protein ColTof4_05503 [Colletotrichum tofieldiae]|nr:hypothetical protein ColTof4_05503 [Colletotrichum tofieldiae]
MVLGSTISNDALPTKQDQSFGEKMTAIKPTILRDGTEHPPALVVIVGAGPTGLLLAALLGQKGVRSTVLEKDEALNELPRAVAFSGPVHHIFQNIGIYDTMVQDAAKTPGFCWRKRAEDDGEGGKRLGEKLGEWRLGEVNADGHYEPGNYVLQYPQNKIGKLLLGKALDTNLVTVHCGAELYRIDQNEDGVVAHVRSKHGDWETRGQYIAGCDGGQSNVRRLMGVKMYGHSWQERFMATDIIRTPPVVEEVNIDYIVDPEYWAISTPLEPAKAGQRCLWRFSMAVTDDRIPDEEVTGQAFVNEMLLRHVDGPRPADFEVLRVNLYRMHQFLASTMFRGRCFLAGDAAHLTNPIGGLGLCTGMLDAAALAQAFDLAANRYAGDAKKQKECFKAYSTSRRRVFQTVVHPTSSAAKTRLHCGSPDDIAEEDWYMRTLRTGNKAAIDQLHDGLNNHWRTDIEVEMAASKVSNS